MYIFQVILANESSDEMIMVVTSRDEATVIDDIHEFMDTFDCKLKEEYTEVVYINKIGIAISDDNEGDVYACEFCQ